MKKRWIDSLEIPEYPFSEAQHRYAAIKWLNDALYYAEIDDLQQIMHNCLVQAGGRVVAWRKSLSDQGEKHGDILVADKPQWIASCIRTVSYGTDQYDLRWVESVLRSIWKEEQR